MDDSLFEKVYERPITVQLDLTNGCNLDCFYCYNKQNTIKGKELSDKEYKKVVLKIIKQLNPISITFSGGEPLTRPKLLFKLAKMFSDNDIEIFLNTNGLLITDEIAKNINSVKFELVSINIDSLKKQDDIRNGKNLIKKTIKSLETLSKHYPQNRISISCVVSKMNYKDLLPIAEFVKKNGYRNIHLLDMIPCDESAKKLMLNKEEWEYFYKKYMEIEAMNIKITPNHALLFLSGMEKQLRAPFCMGGKFKMVITANGKIVPCNYFKKEEYICGDTIKDNLLDVWQNAPIMKKFRYFEPVEKKCQQCTMKRLCKGGCRALSDHLLGDPFKADPYCTVYGLK
ncbi:MAG: radical SAM protein [archaeon]